MNYTEDMRDAVSHFEDLVNRPLSIYDFEVADRRSMSINDLGYYDDIAPWAEWVPGELASLSPDDLAAEIEGFRGERWAQLALGWISDPNSMAPIVVIEADEYSTIGDGRGRVSLMSGLYGDEYEVPVVFLAEKDVLVEMMFEGAGKPNPNYDPASEYQVIEDGFESELEDLHYALRNAADLIGISDYVLYAIEGDDLYGDDHSVAKYVDGTSDHPVILVAPTAHSSFDEMIKSVLHELGHAYVDSSLTDDERYEIDEEAVVEEFAQLAFMGKDEQAKQTLETAISAAQFDECVLREYVEMILELDQEDAQEMFGDVMFGDARELEEPDTQAEDELESGFSNWYQGALGAIIQGDIDTIEQLRQFDMYSDVLEPVGPTAYRFISMQWDEAVRNGWVADDPIGELAEGELRIYNMKPISLGTQGGRSDIASSWTNDRDALAEIYADWGNNMLQNYDCLVFFVADVSVNTESFILNPDEMEPIAGGYDSGDFDYSYEQEVVQIGTVKTNGGLVYRVVDVDDDYEAGYDLGQEIIDSAMDLLP